MRVSLTIASLLLLSLAGGAMASDYMLPLLDKPLFGGGSAPAQPGPPPNAEASSTTLAPNQGIAMGVAAVAALVVVGVGFLAFRRSA
ncbi:MAG: hypothetical protein LC624_01220 [Halobacteriales archaeon]|nr:hypothetical protein [Halobacteriales archaeon]